MDDLQQYALIDFFEKGFSESDLIKVYAMYEASRTGLTRERYLFHYANAVWHGLSPDRDPVGAWLASNCSFYSLLLWASVGAALRVSPWFHAAAAPLACLLLNATGGLAVHNRGNWLAATLIAIATGPFLGASAIVAKTGLLRSMRGPRPGPA